MNDLELFKGHLWSREPLRHIRHLGNRTVLPIGNDLW